MLEALLTAFAAAGASAWPSIRIPEAEFAEWVRGRLPAVAPEALLAELRSDDLFLAFACLRSDEDAWRELDRFHLAKIPVYLTGLDRSPAFVDEVRQRLAEKLVRDSDGVSKLAQYSGRGALGAWIRVAAVREAHTIRRGQKPARDIDDMPLLAPGLDPELDLLKQRSAKELKEAFAAVIAALPDDDRTLLRLHYLDGLTIDEVAKAFRVSRASANRLLLEARERIAKRVEVAVRDRDGPNAPHVESLLRLVNSQVENSILRYFQKP